MRGLGSSPASASRAAPTRPCSSRRRASVSIAYAASCTSPWRNRYSGYGRRRSSTISSSRWRSVSAEASPPVSTSRSRSGTANRRPMTDATAVTSRAPGSSRSRRAWRTPCTSSGTSSASGSTASCHPESPCHIEPRSTTSRRASAANSGFPPERSLMSAATGSGTSPSASSRTSARVASARERAQLELPVAVRVALAGPLADPPRARRRGRPGRGARRRPDRCSVSSSSSSIRSSVGSSAQCRSSKTSSTGRSRASAHTRSETAWTLRLCTVSRLNSRRPAAVWASGIRPSRPARNG